VECQPELVSLAATCLGIDQVLATGSALPNFHVHTQLPSLPGLFATSLATIPNRVPYLQADPMRVERYRNQLAADANIKVGIVWRGNPKHKRDRDRSVPLSMFASLAHVPGVSWFSLQVGVTEGQLAGAGLPLVDLGCRFDLASLADLAAALMNL